MSSAVSDADAPPALLAELAAEVDAALAECLARADLPENLREAARYSVLGGGKRLRPALALLSCEAVGASRSGAMPAAVALELIHCFSLVHDDLPAMDDDALRRGQPTLHVHAGEAMAILAGDVMISLAFAELAGHGGFGADVRVRLVAELARATSAMIGGQVYDTLGGFPPGCSDRERLELIDRLKTAALLRGACRMGAMCGHAGPETLEQLTRYGEAVGIMFQVVDDLLDVTQSTEHIGKTAGKDESAGKLTFPGLLGIEAARREVARLHQEADAALHGLGDPAQPLRELSRYLAARTR